MVEIVALLQNVVSAMDEKKAQDIRILDLQEISSVADYFVIATGNSNVQVKAISDFLDDEVGKPIRREGYKDANWVLMDYGSIVVHIFQEDMRRFYDLERLWGNAKEVELSAINT